MNMNTLSERLDLVVSMLDKLLHENKRNKSIEDFDGDTSDILDVTKDCVMLYKKVINHNQEIVAQLCVAKKKILEAENKLLEMEEKSKDLKMDLVKTCKCIEDFEENEIKYKEKIASLEIKLSNLEEEKDVATSGSESDVDTEGDREKILLNSRVSYLEAALKAKEDSEQELKAKLLDTEAAVEKQEQFVEELRAKLKEELDRCKKTVKDKVFVERELKERDLKIKEMDDSLLSLQKKIEELSFNNEFLKKKITFFQSRISLMRENSVKAEKEATQQSKSYKTLSDENHKLSIMLEKKDEDIKSLNQKLLNIINDKETFLQKCLRIQSQKQNTDEKMKHLKSESLNLEKEIMKMKKQISLHNSEVADLNREKELLAKNILKMENMMKKYESDFKNGENERIGLHKELKNARLEIEKQSNIISALEGLKSQLLSDIKSLTKKIESLNDELCSFEDKETSMKVQLAEMTSRLNQQVHISNAAVLDRKLFCQQYKEMKENRDEMKQKIDNLDNYVNELKEILNNRMKEIKIWKTKCERLDLQNKKLNSQLAEQKSDYDIMKHERKHLDDLLNSHLHSNSKKDKEVEMLQSKINEMTEDHKILTSKVHHQVKEIESLEEKVRVTESLLEAEKEKYENYQNSAKFLQLEILRLTGEKNSLVSRISDLEKLKRNFSYTKEELEKERFKNAALERAMQQPINVHRWRLLKLDFINFRLDEEEFRELTRSPPTNTSIRTRSVIMGINVIAKSIDVLRKTSNPPHGTDPEKHQLIENCQAVQKQLLKKSAESEEKDKKILNMNKLLEQLKTMTSHQKDLEEKYMQDARMKIRLKTKADEIKALKFETNMYMAYMDSCQAEIKHLSSELQKLKTRQFFRQKSKTKISPEKDDATDAEELPKVK